ncbi:hypothetical protein BDZ89DRAFT_216328 [Hymenopellis radicata]|nr:hypothetical protein BDZ89DRAFT_216328 [Hymenopellis radicata]
MSNSFSPSALHILRTLKTFFYGMGLYGYLLQLGQWLSLVPPQYEEAAKMHITFVSQCVAAGSYGVLMVIMVWLFIVGVSKLAATSAITSNSESQDAFDPCLVLYCVCGIVNDAVINRAQDTHLVEGALDRISNKMASTFRLYRVDHELCVFGAMFLVAFLLKRRSRAEKGDLEGRVVEKVIIENIKAVEKKN